MIIDCQSIFKRQWSSSVKYRSDYSLAIFTQQLKAAAFRKLTFPAVHPENKQLITSLLTTKVRVMLIKKLNIQSHLTSFLANSKWNLIGLRNAKMSGQAQQSEGRKKLNWTEQ